MMTDWFQVSLNQSEKAGILIALVEMLLKEDASEFEKKFAAEKLEEVKNMDIYKGAYS